MLIRIRLSCDGFELQPHRGDLQPACEAGNNIELFLLRAQGKIDRFYLQQLDISSVCCFNDAVAKIFDRKIILYKGIFFDAPFSSG